MGAYIETSMQAEVAMIDLKEVMGDQQVAEELNAAVRKMVVVAEAEAVVAEMMVEVEVAVIMEVEVEGGVMMKEVVKWVEVELQEENPVAMVENLQEKTTIQTLPKLVQRSPLTGDQLKQPH